MNRHSAELGIVQVLSAFKTPLVEGSRRLVAPRMMPEKRVADHANLKYLNIELSLVSWELPPHQSQSNSEIRLSFRSHIIFALPVSLVSLSLPHKDGPESIYSEEDASLEPSPLLPCVHRLTDL